MEALDAKITGIANKVREMKAAKADKAAILLVVGDLNASKAEYKTLTGTDWKAAATATAAAAATATAATPFIADKPPHVPAKEVKKPNKYAEASLKKEAAAAKAGGGSASTSNTIPETKAPAVYKPPTGLAYYPTLHTHADNVKVLTLAGLNNIPLPIDSSGLMPVVPRLPALSDKKGSILLFGANAICRYLCEIHAHSSSSSSTAAGNASESASANGGAAASAEMSSSLIDRILDLEENSLASPEGYDMDLVVTIESKFEFSSLTMSFVLIVFLISCCSSRNTINPHPSLSLPIPLLIDYRYASRMHWQCY